MVDKVWVLMSSFFTFEDPSQFRLLKWSPCLDAGRKVVLSLIFDKFKIRIRNGNLENNTKANKNGVCFYK